MVGINLDIALGSFDILEKKIEAIRNTLITPLHYAGIPLLVNTNGIDYC
jgi:hypothetical protein